MSFVADIGPRPRQGEYSRCGSLTEGLRLWMFRRLANIEDVKI